ncbi:MAG TPA: cation diffusion facilitator family transporter [Phycisphaerales bacterium]|nr:cation diffusion facilitator family transporter [Phycisphaerales bacterium]
MAPAPSVQASNRRARTLVFAGLATNVTLAALKLGAGIVGNSYALIADAIESLADIFGSAVIWVGLRVAARPRSERHPYGYGKAESLAALIVALLMFGAGIGICIEAIREIRTPHHAPAWWTLLVLAGTVIVKESLFRAVRRAAKDTTSAAVETDAWHHRADAITSAAAFIGIAIALIGGRGYEQADDWAALFAAAMIFINASLLIGGPVRELLDVTSPEEVETASAIAARVPGVVTVHKVFARKSGTQYWLDMHVWVDPAMTVRDAHTLAHAVKDAIREANPRISDVLIHVEPAAERPNTEGTEG